MNMRGIMLAAAVVAAPQPAEAAYYFVTGNAATGTTQVPGGTDSFRLQGASPVSGQASSFIFTASDNGTASTRTWASAETARLKVTAWGEAITTATRCCSGGQGSGSAQARFIDSFTVSSPRYAAGTRATMTVRVFIDGAYSQLTAGGWWSGLQSWSWNFGLANYGFSDGGGLSLSAINGIQPQGSAFGYRDYTVDFDLGAPTGVFMDIVAYTGVGASGPAPSSITAETDLSHTVTWRGISSLKVGGVPVDDFTAFSPTTGFNYRFGVGVPEPSSWAMLIAGFGLTGAVMRRPRRVAA